MIEPSGTDKLDEVLESLSEKYEDLDELYESVKEESPWIINAVEELMDEEKKCCPVIYEVTIQKSSDWKNNEVDKVIGLTLYKRCLRCGRTWIDYAQEKENTLPTCQG